MKVKIVENGWTSYTGPFLNIMFENGVSVRKVTQPEADAIGAIVRVQTVDGKPVGVGQDMIDRYEDRAPIMQHDLVEQTETRQSQEQKPTVYTRSELEAIADDRGIAGLREIGEKLGVKSSSINVLISGILKKQGEFAPTIAEQGDLV